MRFRGRRAQWWDDNPKYAAELLKKAIADGTAVVGRKKIAVTDGGECGRL